jgi:hypothetical protein
VALLAVPACGSDAREPGALLSGELIGRAGGEPFPVQYGHVDDWDGDWGARLGFTDVPLTCDGFYLGDRFPDFSAWIEMEVDPRRDEDWNGAHTIMQNSPRVVLEFDSGELHLDRVDEDSVSGHLAWGGSGEMPGEVYSLEGTFEVERCYREYPGD